MFVYMTSTLGAQLVAARKSLREAEGASRSLDTETIARVIARMGAERFAAMEDETAEIAATIPALRAEVARLESDACPRCAGTGDYSGPTGHLRGGRPLCFDCGGSGRRKA